MSGTLQDVGIRHSRKVLDKVKRAVAGFIVIAMLTFGFAPSALAHDGGHSVGDFLVKTGGLIAAAYNAIRNPATIVRVGTSMATAGGAIIWGQQYGVHAAMYYGRVEYTRTTTNPLNSVTTGP